MYLRQLKKIESDEINGENHFKYDRRKECKITKTISKFIEIMDSRNGFLTGTELSNRIKRVFKVNIAASTIQNHRNKVLGKCFSLYHSHR
jgi:hypothetical protein